MIDTQTTQHSASDAAPFALTPLDIGLLVVRLVLGVIFFAHGAQKVFGWFGGHGLETTVQMMGKGGIPPFLAYLAAFTELLGGLGVLVGLLARLAGLGLSIVMTVAILKVHLSSGLFAPKGFEFPLALFSMAVLILLAGPGRLAIADIEGRVLRRWRPTS